ncbi:hypothetical protein DACRYDRAFT_107624 [Dacryopinax primogenitus]|uniref:FMR1-interacting protein 1 conserved domain-containing protein n=1 Tax=Dacryopinax primogenitus (strain DJM 731) TaxID=1858805 RepID=M5FZF2_DACPD|nr:uncharacterized protein DACRYDRAFT_107624 [Dacryopinax primogenitus]EJU01894.1 hypothetical protein DACRYDRAFT_107624 [Dacryopinax primogenitus]
MFLGPRKTPLRRSDLLVLCRTCRQIIQRSEKEKMNLPIAGTGILLDTPEAIEAWIMERKARWPSAKRIEEKSAAKKAAQKRGEIPDQTTGHRFPETAGTAISQRKPSLNAHQHISTRSRRRGHGGNRPDIRHSERFAEPHSSTIAHYHQPISRPGVANTGPKNGASPSVRPLTPSSSISSGSGESLSDLDPITDAVSSKKATLEALAHSESIQTGEVSRMILRPIRITRRKACGSHPSKSSTDNFMHALLSTEIRATVSRVSQAIQFLVDNDLLEGVEEQVGDTEKVDYVTIISPSDGH